MACIQYTREFNGEDGFDLGLEGSIEIYCLEEDRLLC